MKTVTFEDQEFNSLLHVLANTKDFPWIITNPLLTKLMRARDETGDTPGAAPHSPAGVSPNNLAE